MIPSLLPIVSVKRIFSWDLLVCVLGINGYYQVYLTFVSKSTQRNPGQKSAHKAECIAQRISPEGLAINTLFISSKTMFNKNMEAEFPEI